MKNHRTTSVFVLLVFALLGSYACSEDFSYTQSVRGEAAGSAADDKSADVIIIGAGISGLSAAIEAARNGHSVLILEMSSVFGGHAVIAAGVLNIPVTQGQNDRGIEDSYELAINDFNTWGEDANGPWVNYYVKNANTDIYDWVTDMGISFFAIAQPQGNSVPRVHVPTGSGLKLVTAIYNKALEYENIAFAWNTRADDLILRSGRVAGVSTSNTRSGKQKDYFGGAVIIASGGFQSNIERVLENWPKGLEKPSRILAGSGVHSLGSGLDIAAKVGAKINRLDHQWNYITGIPDPAYDEGVKGLSFFPVPGKPRFDIWLNDDGQRFTNECQSPKFNLPKVLEQPNQRYWSVFDTKNKPNVTISGPGWTKERLQEEIYENPEISYSADSLDVLAEKMNVDVSELKQTISRYNAEVAQGTDRDFGRFGEGSETTGSSCSEPLALNDPPYYAVRLFPLARKSLGGIEIDLDTHVLDRENNPIPGLYAVGEVTGFAGINGKAGLEGTFLGPSIVTGRVAGRIVSAEIPSEIKDVSFGKDSFTIHTIIEDKSECGGCHQLENQKFGSNTGYEHFEFVHELVQERQLVCQTCHVTLFPYNSVEHRWDERSKINTCAVCHGGGD